MGKRGILILVLLIVFCSFFASGSFFVGNKSSEIESSYSPNEKVKGWINISLQQESSGSLVSGNFGGNISLIELLKENNANYACVPKDCKGDYSLNNGESLKHFEMGFGDERVFAFSLTGIVSSVSGFSMNISINNQPACINPAEIDIFDDESSEWASWNFSNEFACLYEEGMGCFKNSDSVSEVNISSIPFCEKIKLVPSGKFRIGAWIRKVGGSGELKMELAGITGGIPLASCILPEANSSGGEIGCVIYYNNTQLNDYYVCLRANASNSYATKIESNDSCGYFAIGSTAQSISAPASGQTNFDYYIFARGARFGAVGSFSFNQREYGGQGNSGELSNEIMNYLRKRYANSCSDCAVNCTNICAVPAKFKSFGIISSDISDIKLSFLSYSGETDSNKIYDAVKSDSLLNSGFLKLDLGKANLSLPSAYGSQNLSVFLNGVKIASKSISIAKIPIIRNVMPRNTQAGVETLFTADVYSPSNKSITSYSWNFGDGASAAGKSVKHAYSKIGMYTLTLQARDSDGASSSKNFAIIVGSPAAIANSTLKDYRMRMNNLTAQIGSYPAWKKTALEKEIGIEEKNSELTELERKFILADSDEEYSAVMQNLSELEIPRYIKESGISNFPVFFDIEEINLNSLSAYDEDYLENDSENVKSAIVKWYSDNLEASADYSVISAYYDDEARTIFTYYKLKIKAKNPEDDEAYVIINSHAEVSPQENSKEIGDATGIKILKIEDRDVEFLASGQEAPFELGIYIAPRAEKLDLELSVGMCNFNNRCEDEKGENWKNCKSDCKPWGWVIFYFVLVLFLAFATYIFLQEWYKRKYESHLFKNRNDLYNIVNFISSSLAKGMEKGEIARNLKRAGWSSEQISYALKKVKGKRIGMPIEIGLPKITKK